MVKAQKDQAIILQIKEKFQRTEEMVAARAEELSNGSRVNGDDL
jgi:hypothetical protein